MSTLKLVLARHGQAVSYAAEGDRERPLTPLGHRQAEALGKALLERDWLPSLCLCSPAQRTRETWDSCASQFSEEVALDFPFSFYLGGPPQITTKLNALDVEEHGCVLLLGHNPGWSDAIQFFSDCYVSLGTADAALLEISADSWSEASGMIECWTCVDVWRAPTVF